jgi:hypothetical protein
MVSEVYVSESRTPAHVVRASATPRAIARMVGLLELRPPTKDVDGNWISPCEATPDGGAIWRLTQGIVVTLSFDGPDAHWSLDVE